MSTSHQRVCKFHPHCRKGDRCSFFHPPIEGSSSRLASEAPSPNLNHAPPSKELCVFWERGSCRGGSTCRFVHADVTVPQPFNILPSPIARRDPSPAPDDLPPEPPTPALSNFFRTIYNFFTGTPAPEPSPTPPVTRTVRETIPQPPHTNVNEILTQTHSFTVNPTPLLRASTTPRATFRPAINVCHIRTPSVREAQYSLFSMAKHRHPTNAYASLKNADSGN